MITILKDYYNCKNGVEKGRILMEYAWGLEALGWHNIMIEGGVVSPDNSTIFIYARSPYNGEIRQFSTNYEGFKKIRKEFLNKGDFITYNNK